MTLTHISLILLLVACLVQPWKSRRREGVALCLLVVAICCALIGYGS